MGTHPPESEQESRQKEKTALIAGLLSYVCWGFFPIYWKYLKALPALAILAHQMIWSCVFYLMIYALFALRKKTLKLIFVQSLKQWLLAGLATLVLAINWGICLYVLHLMHQRFRSGSTVA